MADDGEELERDAALREPRHVHVAALGAREHVPVPQERVGVHVRHEQPRVQRPRTLRRAVRPTHARPVKQPLRHHRHHRKERQHAQHGEQEEEKDGGKLSLHGGTVFSF